jgi:hypothetical protein
MTKRYIPEYASRDGMEILFDVARHDGIVASVEQAP